MFCCVYVCACVLARTCERVHSLKWSHIFTCVCMCRCSYTQVYTHVGVDAEARNQSWGCCWPLWSCLPCFLKHSLSNHLRTLRIDSAGQQAQETLLSPALGSQHVYNVLHMYILCLIQVLGMNAGPRSCKASILPTERSLSISFFWVAQAGHRLLSS